MVDSARFRSTRARRLQFTIEALCDDGRVEREVRSALERGTKAIFMMGKSSLQLRGDLSFKAKHPFRAGLG
jgi:hypothetical protein